MRIFLSAARTEIVSGLVRFVKCRWLLPRYFLLFLFGDFFLALIKSVIGFSHSYSLLYNSRIGVVWMRYFSKDCALHSSYNIEVWRGHRIDSVRPPQAHNA